MFKKGGKSYTDLLGKTNRIVEGTTIEGNIQTSADLRLDGVINGNLQVDGRVVVGPTGRVKGDVTCTHADVEGSIEGVVRVSHTLIIKSTAYLDGEVIVGKLSVEPGAVFKASCAMLGVNKDGEEKE